MNEDKPKTKGALLAIATGALLMASMQHDRVGVYREPEKKAPPSPETRESRHRQKMARKKQRRAQR